MYVYAVCGSARVISPFPLRSFKQISTAAMGDMAAIGPIADQQLFVFDIQLAHEANGRRALGHRCNNLIG